MSGLATPDAPDLHVVIWERRVETTAGPEVWSQIVAGPTDWSQAQDRWHKFDTRRRLAWQGDRNLNINRNYGYYKVRSIRDPEVAPLLERCSFHAKGVLAAKAWGKANAIAGAKGGWIYGITNGGPVQGWANAVSYLRGQNNIDLGQHPKSGKPCWVNFGTVTVRNLKKEVAR